jgi:hypothetical protein
MNHERNDFSKEPNALLGELDSIFSVLLFEDFDQKKVSKFLVVFFGICIFFSQFLNFSFSYFFLFKPQCKKNSLNVFLVMWHFWEALLRFYH